MSSGSYSGSGSVSASGSQTSTNRRPPPLPDRASRAPDSIPKGKPKGDGDPRTSSSQSLGSPSANTSERRTLLLVYLHGFMGNDSSFRSFPAHVHNLLKHVLADSHAIHSKIYPRYKTYKAIDVARDNLSHWLAPHESPTTDVILLGHSMGGLLAAEAVLMPNNSPYGQSFQHRILGTVCLDAPLLGLHPGIVVSGIASLFRPAPPAPGQNGQASGSSAGAELEPFSPNPSIYSEISPPSGATSPSLPMSPMADGRAPDPDFNPPFFNDVVFQDRGWLRNIAHFAKKHSSENLVEAATQHIMSHLEFGSCLADYPGMHSRYKRLRKLEDVDDLSETSQAGATRVRFVNYYTASTGRPKESKETKDVQSLHKTISSTEATDDGSLAPKTSTDIRSGVSTPRISVEDTKDREELQELEPMQMLEPMPEVDDEEPPVPQASTLAGLEQTDAGKEGLLKGHEAPPPRTSDSSLPGYTTDPEALSPTATATAEETVTAELGHKLPEIPSLPSPPETIDLDQYTDKDERKRAEADAKKARKAYEAAVKTRDKVIKHRQQLIEKHRRTVARDLEKQDKKTQKEVARRAKEDAKRLEQEEKELRKEIEALRLAEQQRADGEQGIEGGGKKKEKAKKERKFCMLPNKVNGQLDDAWVKVYMEGVDEVGAHCGIFFPGPHYEKLVGEVGSKIAGWVHEDASKRLIKSLQ